MSDENTNPKSVGEQLGKLGINISSLAALDALELPEPQYGEEVVGKLEEDEAALVVDLSDTNREADALGRQTFGDGLARLGDAIKENREQELAAQGKTPGELMLSETQAQELYRLQQRVSMLHAKVHWMVGERLNMHHWRLGFRSKGRIVKVARRY